MRPLPGKGGEEMTLKDSVIDLRREKKTLEQQIFDLIAQFEKNTDAQIKDIEIVRVQSYSGRMSLMGIKATIDL